MKSIREEIEEVWKKYEEEKKRQELMQQAREAAVGFAKGVAGATYDLANGATFGGLGKIDEKYFNGKMHDLNKELEKDADIAEVGDIYRGLKEFNEGVGTGLGILGAKNIGSAGLNEAVKWNGRRDLIGQLERGENFRDINFGKINKGTLEDINKIRILDNQEPINSRTTIIPSENIEHIYQRRILDNKYTPRDVSETISDALFKTNKVYQGNPTDHQILLHNVGRGGKMAVVDKNLKGDGISVITALKRRNVNNLEGRQSPSSVPSYQNLTGSKHSTPQIVNNGSVTSMENEVNMTIEELLKKWRRLLGF